MGFLFSRVELDLQKRILNLSIVWMGMGVLLGEVVWEGLESELHPMSSWWRWPLVKNELQLSMTKLVRPTDLFQVGLASEETGDRETGARAIGDHLCCGLSIYS